MKLYFLTGMGLLLAAAHAAASVDTSAPPGGVYRLKPGIYVAEATDCAAPANAAVRQYDGKGLGTVHTRACKAVVRARKGNSYTVDQSCIDAGAGPAPRAGDQRKLDALCLLPGGPAASRHAQGCAAGKQVTLL